MITYSLYIMILTVVLLVPIIKELFFRKILLDYFIKWGMVIGIGVSSFLLGFMNIIAGDFVFLPI